MALLSAVALLSAAALGYEVLLMRLFSIEEWHHFAYMVIALALLGYGASGTFLSFTRARLLASFPAAFAASAGLFGVSAPAAFALARAVPLNTLEIVWDRGQQLSLALVYLILAVPFLCAATGIGLALARRRETIGRVYRADLVGAGCGAAGIVAALFVLPPAACLQGIAGLGLTAAAFGCWDGTRRAWPAALVGAALALPVLWPTEWATPRPSPYKGLSLALTVPGARVVAERSSPLGLLSVVASPDVPLRHAPGLSLGATMEPPAQLGVFTDGGALTAITRFDGDTAPLAYLDQRTAALPYHLLRRPRVLVLGAGGGGEVLLARLHRAPWIDAVEINRQMVDLVRRDFADFAGPLYAPADSRVHVAEARRFVADAGSRFDLIQVALVDSFSAAAAGLQALDESTLYTVEAFETYLEKLAPGGFLALTRWLKVPPRDSLKLVDTARQALQRRGVDDAARRLVLIRGWRTTTLLVKNGVLSADDLAAVRDFCRERSFDVAYLPGMEAAEANRRNVLDRPYLFIGASALLGAGRQRFLADYAFDVAAATDDRPYFFYFLTWRGLGELLEMPAGGGLALIEWGYVVLLAALAQAVLVSLVLILLPLSALRRLGPTRRSGVRLRIAVYFLGLGMAFLFIEMASIQRFVLFLGHPLYAVAVVLCAFLVCAGVGAGFAARLARRCGGEERAVGVAVAGIAVIAGLHVAILPEVLAWLEAWAPAARVAAALVVIAPLAVCMGLPFPLGLAWTAAKAPEMVPWAWGINGCASVVSAVLATLLAIDLGFSVVVLLAIGLYGMAAAALARRR